MQKDSRLIRSNLPPSFSQLPRPCWSAWPAGQGRGAGTGRVLGRTEGKDLQTGTGRLGRARGSITSVGNAALRAPSREPAEGRTPGGQVPAEGPPCHGLCHRVIFILSEGRGLGARSQGLCCVLGPRLSSVVSWARATVNTQKAKSVFQTRKCLVVTPRGAAAPLLREPRPEPPGLHSDPAHRFLAS